MPDDPDVESQSAQPEFGKLSRDCSLRGTAADGGFQIDILTAKSNPLTMPGEDIRPPGAAAGFRTTTTLH